MAIEFFQVNFQSPKVTILTYYPAYKVPFQSDEPVPKYDWITAS